MGDVATYSPADFVRSFSEIRKGLADAGVVKVVDRDRLVGGFLSPEELDHYERLKRQEREVLTVGDLPDEFVKELEASLTREGG